MERQSTRAGGGLSRRRTGGQRKSEAQPEGYNEKPYGKPVFSQPNLKKKNFVWKG